MKRVVFCWELGGNYGHISGFINLYRHLKVQGFEVAFILRSLKYTGLLSENAQTNCFKAPIPNIIPTTRVAYSYADILAQIGYLDEAVLSNYLKAWRDLLIQTGADLVVADHAPTALLAAQTLGLPSAAIGTGFVMPPGSVEFPLYLPDGEKPVIGIDHQLVIEINKVLKKSGARSLEEVGNIFSRSQQFLCTFPELDHYGYRQETEYWGPLFSDDIGEVFSWPKGAEPRIFAYLTPKIINLSQVIRALATLPGFKLLHIPGMSANDIEAYQAPNLKILSTPVNMRSLLSEGVEMVVSQGGMGLASQCFLAGIKQVIIPTQMEQHMLAQRMSSQELAYGIAAENVTATYRDVFHQALGCPVLAHSCALIKQKYTGFSQTEQIEALVEDMVSPLL